MKYPITVHEEKQAQTATAQVTCNETNVVVRPTRGVNSLRYDMADMTAEQRDRAQAFFAQMLKIDALNRGTDEKEISHAGIVKSSQDAIKVKKERMEVKPENAELL